MHAAKSQMKQLKQEAKEATALSKCAIVCQSFESRWERQSRKDLHIAHDVCN